MTFTFTQAKRENVRLLIGLAGASGSGKTYSAMTMASGIAGNKPFAVIDTENGRSKHYADQFRFDVGDLQPPFRPKAYEEAILAADAAGYPVIVVDSMSHEWAGEGGCLDWQEEELDRMAGQDYRKREACKMASWIKPKSSHKDMMSALLRVKAHVILCFRAEAKIEMVKGERGWEIKPKQSLTGLDGWIPVCEKTVPFELTVSFLLTPDRPGYGRPIKLQEQHKALFPLDHPINAESGRLIALWASGGTERREPPTPHNPVAQAVTTKPRGRFNAEKALSAFHQYGVTTDEVVARLGHYPTEGDRDTIRAWGAELVEGKPWPREAQGGDSVPGDPPGETADQVTADDDEGFGP